MYPYAAHFHHPPIIHPCQYCQHCHQWHHCCTPCQTISGATFPSHHRFVQRKRPLTEFWKTEVFNSLRHLGKLRAKRRLHRGNVRLKRLAATRPHERTRRRLERFWRFAKRIELYSSWRRVRNQRKLKQLQLQQLQQVKMRRPPLSVSSSPAPCSLWWCPRKKSYRFEFPKALLPPVRSRFRCHSRASTILSDMSRRSRTPIRGLRSSK